MKESKILSLKLHLNANFYPPFPKCVKNRVLTMFKAYYRKRINEDLKQDDCIINLASTEYYKSVNKKKLKANVITPIFKDLNKNGDYKIVMMYAKNARGVMANFIIKNRTEEPEALKSFNENGYIYDAHGSTENEWVFLRG